MQMVFQSLWNRIVKNPLRALLTVIGIGIGVTSITIAFSITYSFNRRIDELLEGGLKRVTIANAELFEGGMVEWAEERVFSEADLDALKTGNDRVLAATPMTWAPFERFLVEDTYYRLRLALGAGTEYEKLYGLELAAGSFFGSRDISEHRKIAVISESAARIMFGSVEEAVGRTVFGMWQGWVPAEDGSEHVPEWRRVPLTVTGVFRDVPDLRRNAYGVADLVVPYNVLDDPGVGRTYILSFAVLIETGNVMREAASLTRILTLQHGETTPVAVWEGHPMYPNRIIESMRGMARTVSVFFGAFGMLSLLVSSFGILGMMMVNVLERTREIGLRRTLGATKLGVIGQFVTEAAVLVAAGSLLGLALACLFNHPAQSAVMPILADMGLPADGPVSPLPDIVPVLYALAAAFGVGTVFGFFPALSAARISPVESLREG